MNRKEIEEMIAEKIVGLLDDGLVPWKKGWTTDGSLPANFYSKRPYRGMNSLWLGLIAQSYGFESPYWTTARAAISNDGCYPKKGSKASYAILWKPMTKTDEETGKDKRFFLMRMYPVFNTDQIDGLVVPKVERTPVEVPDALAMLRESYPKPPALFHQRQDRAFYVPSRDEITLPMLDQFESSIAYAETWAHEHIHSTGHPDRLGRIELHQICRSDYAFEELVAEIGAAMLLQGVGIEMDLPAAAGYIDGWRRAITDDPSLVVSAAQKAQKACDFIHAAAFDEEVAA